MWPQAGGGGRRGGHALTKRGQLDLPRQLGRWLQWRQAHSGLALLLPCVAHERRRLRQLPAGGRPCAADESLVARRCRRAGVGACARPRALIRRWTCVRLLRKAILVHIHRRRLLAASVCRGGSPCTPRLSRCGAPADLAAPARKPHRTVIEEVADGAVPPGLRSIWAHARWHVRLWALYSLGVALLGLRSLPARPPLQRRCFRTQPTHVPLNVAIPCADLGESLEAVGASRRATVRHGLDRRP